METVGSGFEEQMELPPGFRFHPSDEELITHYLSPKVVDSSFCAKAIGEVDLNKVEPWDLPWRAKMGEKEWYFFCVRDRKYPTGSRTNRATDAGYWKATGKDKEIFREKSLVGMKKTLVFYKGRAPRGEKTNWVMHEYRLEGKFRHDLPKTAKNEWVICRIFKKCSGGKKIHISGLVRSNNCGGDSRGCSSLPPLMEISCHEDDETRASAAETSHVSCFSSDQMEDHKPLDNNNWAPINFPKTAADLSKSPQIIPFVENLQYMDSSLMLQDQSILKLLLEGNDVVGSTKGDNVAKAEFSQDTEVSSPMSYQNQDFAMTSSVAPEEFDCLWNYY